MKYLKLHNLKAGEWCDRDEMLIEASFQILVDFMEVEKPGERIVWDQNPEHKKAWDEMNALYEWWKNERSNRESVEGELLDKIPRDYMVFVKCEDFGSSKEFAPKKIKWEDEKYPEVRVVLDKLHALEEEWFKEDQENLHRLVEIRPFLWT